MLNLYLTGLHSISCLYVILDCLCPASEYFLVCLDICYLCSVHLSKKKDVQNVERIEFFFIIIQ